MTLKRISGGVLAWLLLSAPAFGATVTSLAATHQNGQTFLTFTEIAGAGVTYTVWRSTSQITSTGGLTAIATLNQDSGLNLHTSTGFVITDAGSPLSSNQGLLVWTTATSGNYYYAVTNSTDATISVGTNSLTSPVAETFASAPGCVLQEAVSTVSTNDLYKYFCWEDYSTWKHSAWGLYAHKVWVHKKPSLSVGVQYPLFLISHPADGGGWMDPLNYTPPNANLTTQTSQGSYILIRDDNFSGTTDPYTGAVHPDNSTYDLGNYYATDDRVYFNTQNRYRRYIQWISAQPQFQVDTNRVYCQGASRGGGGCMHFAARNSDLIAAASVAIGWVDTTSINHIPMAGELMITGTPTYNQFQDQAWNVANQTYMPPIMYYYGANDGTVSPNAYPGLWTAYETKNTFFWAAQWASPTNGHTTRYLGSQYNSDPDPSITSAPALDVLRFKLNESYPAISSASSNDSPGTSGSLTSAGQINRYIDWHSALHSITGGSAITDTSNSYGISLVSTRGSSFTADVTIQNTQSFNPISGQTVNWSYSSGGSGSVSANSDGSVTIPSLTIGTSAARLSLTMPLTAGKPKQRLRIRG